MNKQKTMFDLLGFLAPQTLLPIIDPRLKDKDICISVTAVAPFITDVTTMLSSVNEYCRILEAQGIHIVLKKSDLQKSGLKVILNLQAPPPFVGFMDKFFDAGIRICQIAYMEENNFGGGFLAPTARLTDAGRALIAEMEVVGMILDLAHSGAVTSLDALEIVSRNEMPVIISHTGAYGEYCNMRNSINDVLQKTVSLGGLIGIYTLTFGLSKNDNSIAAFEKHMSYILNNIDGAVGSLCIGSDGWFCEDKGRWSKTYEFLKDKLDPLGLLHVRFPDQIAELMSPHKLDIIYREMCTLFNVSTVKNICYNNGARFFAEALPD
ncbi:MAG: hypothetical protein RL641_831 [Candidatus Parcubacteria bacterium]|jgi:microsomal dipeptidase-like Zn-dependent dipeptidase